MLLVAVVMFAFMGREFLPPFNEGTLNINANMPPGTSLQESNRIGNVIESVLHEVPEVVSTTRRTGRAELDEHAAGVNTSEIEVVTTEVTRPHAEFMEDVRQRLARIPGVEAEVGQPISHRIDHLLSGTRAHIAVKLFGPDLATLRTKAAGVRDQMAGVEGIVDLIVEPQVGVPQVQINMNRTAAAAVGLRAGDLAETVDTAFNGHVASQVLEEQKTYDVLVRFDDAARLLRRFGQPALLLSWVPVIGDVMVALAGAMRVPFTRFSLWVALGKAARYVAVAWAASAA